MKQLAQDQVLFSDTNGSVRMLFERTLAGAGARIDKAVEAGSVEAVKHCAIAGIGFGVLPSFAVDAEIRKRNLVAVPILDAEMTVEIQMVRAVRSWQSPAVRALWTMIRPDAAVSSAA
jgi:DNA-binding transcriptional LysR family regulator